MYVPKLIVLVKSESNDMHIISLRDLISIAAHLTLSTLRTLTGVSADLIPKYENAIIL